MIHLLTGPMGAMKTNNLITLAMESEASAFVPADDTKSKGELRSRTGKTYPATAAASLEDIQHHMIKNSAYAVAIDEIHCFCRKNNRFDIQAWKTFILACIHSETFVCLAGLNIGHEGRPLEPAASIMSLGLAMPEYIKIEVLAGDKCEDCFGNNPATHSWLNEDLEEPIYGDLGKEYTGLCTHHFYRRMKARLDQREINARAYR